MTVDTSAVPEIGRGKEVRIAVVMRDNQNPSAAEVENSPVILQGNNIDCVAYSKETSVDSSTSIIVRRRVDTVYGRINVLNVGYSRHSTKRSKSLSFGLKKDYVVCPNGSL